jgi:hypothetical protein
MSEVGQTRPFRDVPVTSALALIADLRQKDRQVRKVPNSEIRRHWRCDRRIGIRWPTHRNISLARTFQRACPIQKVGVRRYRQARASRAHKPESNRGAWTAGGSNAAQRAAPFSSIAALGRHLVSVISAPFASHGAPVSNRPLPRELLRSRRGTP